MKPVLKPFLKDRKTDQLDISFMHRQIVRQNKIPRLNKAQIPIFQSIQNSQSQQKQRIQEQQKVTNIQDLLAVERHHLVSRSSSCSSRDQTNTAFENDKLPTVKQKKKVRIYQDSFDVDAGSTNSNQAHKPQPNFKIRSQMFGSQLVSNQEQLAKYQQELKRINLATAYDNQDCIQQLQENLLQGLSRKKKITPLEQISQINFLENKNPEVVRMFIKQDYDQVERIIQNQNRNNLLSFKIKMLNSDLKSCRKKPPLQQDLQSWMSYVLNVKEAIKTKQLCLICLGSFTVAEQQQQEQNNLNATENNSNRHVYLGCGHQYHEICLKNYQKHFETRKCPVCKKTNYQQAYGIQQSIQLYIYCQVSLIQKYIRKSNSKKRFFQLIKTKEYTPKTPRLKQRLKNYQEQSIGNEKLQNNVKKNTVRMKRITLETERVDTYKVQLLQLYSKKAEIMLKKQVMHYNKLLNYLIDLVLRQRNRKRTPEDMAHWINIRKRNQKRADQICSICQIELNSGNPLLLTSCSHTFHFACLISFTIYAMVTYKQMCNLCNASITYEPLIMNEEKVYGLRDEKSSSSQD